MTQTLTTEELRQIVETDHVQCGDAAAMAHELLANREAQPVFYVEKATVPTETVQTIVDAPAVNAALCSFYEDATNDNAFFLVRAIMEACRAAMLAQPVSQGYKLPPHAYRELVNSLRDTAVKYSGTDQLRERLNTTLSQFIEPDHPHTRTAAPDSV